MTKLEEEKKARDLKKKQRMVKFQNGANYSNRLIRSFNNLKKRENKSEIKILRTTNNIRNDILTSTSDFSKTKLTMPSKGTVWNQDKGNLEFVPFLQERDGMGKLIAKDKDETRRVKIIRLNTRATNREKDFSMSVDLKNTLTHFVYEGILDRKGTESAINRNTITAGSFLMNDKEIGDKEQINYSKFEIKKLYEPFIKPPFSEKDSSTNISIRPIKTANERRPRQAQTPCIGSYDYSTDYISKKITRNFIFPNEHPDYDKSKNKTNTMMNLSDIYQKLDNHQKLIGDFGKQLGRSESLLKWAPAIHETENLKNKMKEQEFKGIDSKDLERDYHFNRYLQKKYVIKNYVPPFTQDIKKSVPLTKDDFKERTLRLIQKYDFKSSVPEFKRIFKVHI